ncbi:MAG: sugar phosphate nucleotidyltransferase [Candidatus Cohnella colombiensis]|uniref:Glucose-1-phosphate thymidylyltransferase n=1 Tax=Candidatus Cohnella colombiensis TaxID=3121368 RepID=A0AA95EUF7_9BACL|nr:MAG: sugar phosphate nucleotidyltransferase [Cohnella sp.]
MKGLILGAGNGTRLEPFSLKKPKVLLPVTNKPIVHYCIEKLVQLGIQEIGIVIKPAFRQMFMEQVGTGDRWGVCIHYVEQRYPKGIADAVKHAADFIEKDSFMLLLGDNMIEHSLAQLKDAIDFHHYDASILLGEVSNPHEYGIAEVERNRIISLEEKPRQPKSNLAVLGAYAFSSRVFEAVNEIVPSERGEYEIIDALKWLVNKGYPLTYEVTYQMHTDVGRPDRWLQANQWVLDRLYRIEGRNEFLDSRGNRIIVPVVIDESAVLNNCTIGPHASIGAHVCLDRCIVRDSIITENVVREDSLIENAIIGSEYMPYLKQTEALS